ncbi:YbaK/ebsC protein [Enterococcus faecium]|nr:YbaK/ebsC protein [Enterococcus faecium]
MAKKKIVKTNAIRMVEQKKIPYTEHEYEWDESHLSASSVAEQLPESQSRIFKTLVAVGNVTGPLVAVIPGEAGLNLKKLAKVSGNKKVEMLHLKDLEATTGIHTWWLLAYRYEKTISYLFRSNCRKL